MQIKKMTALTLVAAATALACAPQDARALSVTELTVEEIEDGLQAGTFTSESLTEAFFEQIAKYEPTYNAFISLSNDALAKARALDLEYKTSGPRSPLHGVPVVIKDNMDQAGKVTTNGYSGFSSKTNGIDIVPTYDASVVARLEAAGAVIIGKTNLPDFANDGLRSNSTVEGITYNPSRITKVPGGSSGGTASAVNASMGVLGLGTETGRSIHNPAVFQSLVGLRPTHGLVPIDGIAPLNGSFRDVAGPLAKRVYDAAVTMDAIAGESEYDPLTTGAQKPAGGYTSKLSTTALQGAKIGTFDPQFLPLGTSASPTFRTPDAETQTLYNAALAKFGSEGATLYSDDIFGSAWTSKYYSAPTAPNSQRYDQWKYFQNLGPNTPFDSWETYREELTAQGKPFVNSPFVTETTDTVDTRTTAAGVAWLAWQEELRDLFASTLDTLDLDALVWPVNGKTAPALFGGPNNDPLVQGAVNILGIPGVILPSGRYADGTPFGVIVMGRMFDEASLLGLAYDYEQATLGTSLGRVVPTLVIPEPGVAAISLAMAALLLRRRAA